ncbi:helix-turn-helix transcriptional regulator [Actinoallomurus sp. NPDC052274]|uniref:helix-turn-helix domain-containing protein n=1 Tax=Actinoallomurus sp. NPDC052274 TaxID=3155420 RepID=UPI00343146A9
MTARQFVGKEIRRARESKQLTRAELAKTFPVSESLVASWENGRLIPKPEYLPHLISSLGLPALILRILDDLVSREVAPEWLGKWTEAEADSSALLAFAPLVVPGLLQTDDYARAVLCLGKPAPLDLEGQVSVRLARQKVLTREDPPLYHAVLDEAVIRRPVGGPEVMHDQLMRLVELSRRDHIIVQVIPFSVGAHAGFAGGPIELASIDGAEVAYVDNALRGDVIEKTEDVAAIRRLWQMLSAKALHEEASIELITKAAETWAT